MLWLHRVKATSALTKRIAFFLQAEQSHSRRLFDIASASCIGQQWFGATVCNQDVASAAYSFCQKPVTVYTLGSTMGRSCCGRVDGLI